ncbi:MAG: TetR/AcrR family transcriptional regulator [bacterium]
MDDEPDPRIEGRASRRATKTRQRLLDAALYIFNTKGIEGCAIEDITESADVGKGTFYRHFMDKLDILRTLLDLAADDLILRMPPTDAPALSFEDRITQLFNAHATLLAERADLFLVFLQGQTMVATRSSSIPGLQPPFARYITALESRLKPVLPDPADVAGARQLAVAIGAIICGNITVGMSILSSKHDVINNLDLARQSLLVGTSQRLRCTV